MLQQITLGGAMIALPIFLQMMLEYNAHAGRPVARAAVADACSRSRSLAGKRAAERRPASIIRAGFALRRVGHGAAHPDRARAPTPAGALVVPLIIAGVGARPAGVAAQQLHARPRSTRSGSARPPA